jgi:site-specific DNA recombinase
VQLKKVLLRERNAGLLVRNGVVYEDSIIEPAVSREDWELVRSILQSRSTGGHTPRKEENWLSGLLVCSVCSLPMTAKNVTTNGIRERHYMCVSRVERTHNDSRRHVSILARIAEDAVADKIIFSLKALEMSNVGRDEVRATQVEIAAVEQDIRDTTDLLMEKYADKSRIRVRLNELGEKLEKLVAYRAGIYLAGKENDALVEMASYFDNGWTDNAANDAAAVDRAYAAWELLSGDRKRAVAGVFRLVIAKGGKGEKRVVVTTI